MRYLLIILCLFLGLNSQAQGLKAGPMLGMMTSSSVKLWAWAEAGDTLVASVANKAYEQVADKDGFVHMLIESLSPSTNYRYTLRLNGEALSGTWSFRTFSDQKVFDFDMALGSCAYIVDSTVPELMPGRIPFGARYEIFDTIANRKPDVMFWLGDNIYLRDNEWESRERVLSRYAHSRQHPSYAHLLSTSSHLAIWDDHDYGPNDSNSAYEGRAMTRDVFLKQWLNPEPATDSGIYATHRISDVEFFLLDDRSFRPKYEDGSMFGQTQQAWLFERLKASSATFKIVATGSQLLSTQKLGEAYWERHEEALQVLLDSISALHIPGIMFVSGDVHVVEISRYDLEGGYPLYDFTFSPMTSLPNPVPVKNYRRVRKSYYKKRNFGWMGFRGEGDNRRMIVSAINRKGKTIWEHVIYAKALGW